MVDKRDFYIPQILEEEEKEDKKEENTKYVAEKFVSPIHGTKVKDEAYFNSVSYNNRGRQYDAFRDKDKRVVKDDFSEYIIKETSAYSSGATRNAFGGNNDVDLRNINDNPYEEDVNYPNEDNYDTLDDKENSEDSYYEYEDNNQEEYDDYSNEIEELEDNNQVIDIDDYSSNRIEEKKKTEKKSKYVFPPLSILDTHKNASDSDYSGTQRQRDIIDKTLKEFDIAGRVVRFTKGPTVTLFEVQLDPGVKYSKVPSIQDNIQGNLEAISIRIEAPIPGKATVGIEVPNEKRDVVYFGDLINNKDFLEDNNPTNVILGMDVGGNPVYLDIKDTPHALVAGSTGSGKSICINVAIASIIYKAHPDDVKLILIDPKKVEFSKYRGLPHLATPIITDNKLAAATLKWACDEMENRYELFMTLGASNYKEYLQIINANNETKHLPYIVIIIDEYADLAVSGADVEDYVMRLTAKARAAGIHLLVCTQRPTVNVINGTIKANIPARIAFKAKTAMESNIIIDRSGAEKLLGKGDMIYIEENGRERRIQGAFISPSEIITLMNFIKSHSEQDFLFDTNDLEKQSTMMFSDKSDATQDEHFYEITRYIVATNNASINYLSKRFNHSFNRIQAIIQKLEELGVVSENLGSRARKVLVTPDELEDILSKL